MADQSNRRLGNYKLIRLLAGGGFAEVYLGQHIYLNNQAAIKVLLTQLSDYDRQRFLNEARTLVNLLHPNIVRVLEFGIEDTIPFLVMDYAPNGSLRKCNPKGTQLSLKEQQKPQGLAKEVHVWRFGRRQLLATIIGIILYVVVQYLPHLPVVGALANIFAFFFSLLIVLFLGVIYGPWVGLLTGGVGGLLYSLIFADINYFSSFPGLALIGFIAGLSLFSTKSHFNNFRAITLATGISLFAAIAGTALSDYIYFPAIYIQYVASAVSILIFLPIALIIYNAITRRRKHA